MSQLLENYANKIIALQTRAGVWCGCVYKTTTDEIADIDNELCSQPSPSYAKWVRDQARKIIAETNQKHPGKVHFRMESSVAFDCHGLTFASRRTSISDSAEIRKILRHDGYRQIDAANVTPGDIVLYVDDGDVAHSGIVVSVPKDAPPLILSKWGKGPEALHPVDICPTFDRMAREYHRVIT
jgi:hypothetical protein